jgi:acetyltransferase-like isoleucine patch superfamily enzyme
MFLKNKIKITNKGHICKTVKFIGNGSVFIEKNAEIRSYSIIEMDQGNLIIKEKSVIGYGSVVQCSGNIKIGIKSLIGPNCTILASSHPINNSALIADQPLIRGCTKINDNIWIGANCVVNMGSNIGSNSIIGCNSFVNKDIPENEIWAGSPIKFIRKK